MAYINNKTCKICKIPITGRDDKIFARNRSILPGLMGKNQGQKKIPRLMLDKKKFNFKYQTHIHRSSK